MIPILEKLANIGCIQAPTLGVKCKPVRVRILAHTLSGCDLLREEISTSLLSNNKFDACRLTKWPGWQCLSERWEVPPTARCGHALQFPSTNRGTSWYIGQREPSSLGLAFVFFTMQERYIKTDLPNWGPSPVPGRHRQQPERCYWGMSWFCDAFEFKMQISMQAVGAELYIELLVYLTLCKKNQLPNSTVWIIYRPLVDIFFIKDVGLASNTKRSMNFYYLAIHNSGKILKRKVSAQGRQEDSVGQPFVCLCSSWKSCKGVETFFFCREDLFWREGPSKGLRGGPCMLHPACGAVGRHLWPFLFVECLASKISGVFLPLIPSSFEWSTNCFVAWQLPATKMSQAMDSPREVNAANTCASFTGTEHS